MKKNKKKSTRKASLLNKQNLPWLGGIVFLTVLAALIYAYTYPLVQSNIRKYQIQKIYSSLELSDKYILQRESIFGEKRAYEWDKGRSYSSSREYIIGANVKTTAAELRAAIEKAGFTFTGEPYPGSMQIQYHFKSKDNEYIRMSVSGKPRDDAFQNKILMNKELDDGVFSIDPNEGPSNVIIKVNLDDNNE